jgi:hypothetical protein
MQSRSRSKAKKGISDQKEMKNATGLFDSAGKKTTSLRDLFTVNMPMLLKENKRILSSFPHGEKQLYFDILLSMLYGRPVLDFWKFDDFLQKIYGDYETEQGLSMHELLVKEKGKDFAEYIKGLI